MRTLTCLLLGLASWASAQTVAHRALPVPVRGSPEMLAAPPDPHNDPRWHLGEVASRAASERLFGWYGEHLTAMYDLDGPLSVDSPAAWGATALGASVRIEAANLVPLGAPTADGHRAYVWTGALRTDATVYGAGVYLTGPGIERVSVHLVYRDDGAAEAHMRFLRGVWGRYAPRLAVCAADAQGQRELDALRGINAPACYETGWRQAELVQGVCIGGAIIGCFLPISPVCWASVSCLVINTAAAVEWQHDLNTELRRAEACICARSAARAAGSPIDPLSCPNYRCPEYPIGIPDGPNP